MTPDNRFFRFRDFFYFFIFEFLFFFGKDDVYHTISTPCTLPRPLFICTYFRPYFCARFIMAFLTEQTNIYKSEKTIKRKTIDLHHFLIPEKIPIFALSLH